MIRAFARRIQRWHHQAIVRDLDHCLNHHERLLKALPAEIARLELLRKYHLGRAATLAERRNPVNWNLGRARPQPKGVTE